MDLHLYSAFPVHWPLIVLYNTCHIHPFTHTHSYTDGRGCHARCQPHIRSNLGFIILLKTTLTCSSTQPWGAGIRTSDDPLYPLSYSRHGSILCPREVFCIAFHFYLACCMVSPGSKKKKVVSTVFVTINVMAIKPMMSVPDWML